SLFLGECWQGSKWGWGARGGPDAVSTIAPATYSLLVYRFDYTPTNVLVKLYVNPASMTAEPATATVSGSETAVAFNKIRIVSHGYITGNAGPDGVLDELRVGGTWASVTPYNIRTDAPFSLQMVLGGVVQDSKPAGTLHQGLNYKTIWQPSVTDFNSVTRTGVEQFIMTNSSQITIPTDPDLQSTTGTISFWMNYNIAADGFALPGPGSESAMLFDWRTTSGTIIALNASGGIQFQATAGARFAGVSTVLPDGNWHHVAVTYDQSSNGVVAIYIDGVLDTQANNPNTWTWPTNGDIELGHSRDAYWKIYNGQMDDFRIYSRVLTAGEITTIGTATTSDQLVDTSALKVRYNFDADSTTFGKSVVWPYGTLQSSSSLGSDAAWTSLTNAISPQPIIISPTVPALFYRLTGTP
ncbi:MAG TPA: LamG domain-containing protein, partial [Verrucomicrobiae bacterium]